MLTPIGALSAMQSRMAQRGQLWGLRSPHGDPSVVEGGGDALDDVVVVGAISRGEGGQHRVGGGGQVDVAQVGLDQFDLVQPGLLDSASGLAQHAGGQVHTDDAVLGTHGAGQQLQVDPGSAAQIHHGVTGRQVEQVDGPRAEPAGTHQVVQAFRLRRASSCST